MLRPALRDEVGGGGVALRDEVGRGGVVLKGGVA